MPTEQKLSQLTNNELKEILTLNGDDAKYANKPELIAAVLALTEPSYPPEVEAKLAALPEEVAPPPGIDAGADAFTVIAASAEADTPYIAGDNGALKAAIDALGAEATEYQIRAAVEDYSMALVAVNVYPHDPTYSSAQGEIYSVSNDMVKAHQFVAFKQSLLIPRIIADQLARMEHVQHVTIDSDGAIETEHGYGVNRIGMAPSYNVTNTTMPTRKSLEQMRNRQERYRSL